MLAKPCAKTNSMSTVISQSRQSDFLCSIWTPVMVRVMFTNGWDKLTLVLSLRLRRLFTEGTTEPSQGGPCTCLLSHYRFSQPDCSRKVLIETSKLFLLNLNIISTLQCLFIVHIHEISRAVRRCVWTFCDKLYTKGRMPRDAPLST